MTTSQEQHTRSAIKHNLRWMYAASILVAIMMAAISIAGLAARTAIYPTEELAEALVPNDVVNLFVGLPILLGSMWLARRGSLAGLLCWPGALLFVLYNYLAYIFAVPLSWAFMVHLGLVVLCLYALVGLTAGIDGEVVRQRLAGKVPEKFAAGVITGFGLLFFLRVILVSAQSISSGDLMNEIDYAANFSDFFTSPAMLIGGVLLWRREAFGYLAGLGLLFQASMLFIALIIYLILQPILTTAPFAPVDVIVVAVMGLICFVPFGLYLRGTVRKN
jgi:hypothetical protein